MYEKYIKRLLDIIFAAILLVIASPVLGITALLVRKKLGSPVLFCQVRTGLHNKEFKMYKFRSMTSETDEDGNLLPDEQRLTDFGKTLRATSLDELPGIMNILKGDMSFVGPRPLLPRYVDLYSARQRRRHDVRPGLTGLAQANGRNAIQWEEKFEFDLEYAENISFLMDWKILVQTALKVVKKADINATDAATMQAFAGTKKQRFGNKHQKTLRVLFTNPGNKTEIIQTFMYAAGNLGIRLETYGTDASLGLPAMLSVKYPRRMMAPMEPGYVDAVLQLCKEEHIDLIVPMVEDDSVLSTAKEAFTEAGIQLLTSAPDTVAMCMDKKAVIDFLHACKLHTVHPVNSVEAYAGCYPASIELSDRVKGIYSYRAENEKELRYYASRFDNYLIRPYLKGDQYEIDVFCDFEGNPVFITPKKKETIRENNEIARFRVVQDEMMVLETKALVEQLKPTGPLTIGVVKNPDNGYNYFVSIRPFMSEHAAVSIKAGADIPLVLLKQMYGIKTPYQPYAADDGVIFSRISQSVQITETKNEIQDMESLLEVLSIGDNMEAVIFDLDDVLYSQKDYMRSGLRAVAEHLPKIYNCYNRMCAALEKGLMPIEALLMEEDIFTEELLKECKTVFINHTPCIGLYPEVEAVMRELHRRKKYIGIITDGKPVMQNNKVEALGLKNLVDEVIVTDELAGNGNPHEFRKPNDLAYLIMRKRLGVALRDMAYVSLDGPNAFDAPMKLGMKCYRVENEDKLYD